MLCAKTREMSIKLNLKNILLISENLSKQPFFQVLSAIMGKKHRFYEKGKKRRRDDLAPDEDEDLELDGVPKASTENVEV